MQGGVPHGVVGVHLDGAWSAPWTPPCEGIDEALYHRTPAGCPKLIQGVPVENTTEEEEE